MLVVDDEKTLRDTLEYNLRREGYSVFTAADGPQAVATALAERPDLIILDLMLPGMSGFDVCRVIRRTSSAPILMLSAREQEIDKVVGLEIGADDYMTKPFGLRELLARVHAMLRRSEMAGGGASGQGAALPVGRASAERALVVSGDLAIDPATRSVRLADREVALKPKEFDLLVFLASSPQQVFTRDVLLDRVWGFDYVGGTRTVDVHIRWLRSKLEADPSSPVLIQTVHGVGYKFVGPVKTVKRSLA